MKYFKRFLLIAVIIASCFILDQGTKLLAKKHLAGQPTQSFLFDTFRLSYAENPGAFLSLGADLSDTVSFWLFIVLPAVFLAVLIGYLIVAEKVYWIERITLAMIVGGGLANLYDRIFRHRNVIDFLNFGIGPVFRTGVLNIADMYVTFGFIFLLVSSLLGRDKGKLPTQ